MNRYQILSLFFILSGIVFFVLGFLKGDVEAGIVVIFPFIAGSGVFALIGFLLIFTGILFYIFSFTIDLKDEYNNSQETKKTSIKGGGVVLIGPIPIVFGSNWKITVFMIIIAIVLILVIYFLLRSLFY